MQDKDKELQETQVTPPPMQEGGGQEGAVPEPPPESPPVPQAAQSPVDEFDTSAEVGELETLGKELQDAEASLENNFAKFITDKIDKDASLEELFFSDREEFFKVVLKEQNDFVKNIIEPRVNRANELAGGIQEKQSLEKMSLSKQKFQSEHPDVDINALTDFFINEAPARVQEQIKNAPMEQFFDLVYDYYTQATQPPPQSPPPEEKLPAQAKGVYIPSDNIGAGSNILPMERA